MPLATRLVLSRPAKRIVVLVLILGGLSIAGSITLDVVVTRSATLRVQEDYAALTRSISQYVDQAGQCPAQPDPLSCADRAAISQAAAFATFGQQVSEITFPQQRAATDATRVVRDANQLATLYQRVSSAPSVAAYERDFRVLEPVAHTFDSSYRTLANDLGIG
ncbi:MAG: hypothetical protein ACRDX8_07995 [Acidimicrobiales bacterium]